MFPEHPKNLYGSTGVSTVECHSSGLSLGSHGAVCMVQCAVCNEHGTVYSVPHHFLCALRNSCSRIAVCIEVPCQPVVCKHLLQTLCLPLNLLAVFPRGKGFIFGKFYAVELCSVSTLLNSQTVLKWLCNCTWGSQFVLQVRSSHSSSMSQ